MTKVQTAIAEQYAQVVAKAWEDEAFKQRLMANPRAVLQERGLPPPPGQTVRVIENTAETSYLVLPAKPPVGELADDQLELVAGGFVSEVYQVVDGLSKFAMLYAIAGAGYTWRGASGDPWE
jgi:hypothetical protein